MSSALPLKLDMDETDVEAETDASGLPTCLKELGGAEVVEDKVVLKGSPSSL